MPTVYNNFAYSTLSAAVTTVGQTTLSLQAGHGDRFPVVASPDVAYVTLKNAAGNREIVTVTARAIGSDVLTVTRGSEGTTAALWSIGDVVQLDVTAGHLNKSALAAEHLTSVAGTNTITAVGSGKLTAYNTGQVFSFIPAGNNTGATTINVTAGTGGSALGAKSVFAAGVACVGGELQQDSPCLVLYDGTQFHIISRHAGGTLTATTGTFAGAVSGVTTLGTTGTATIAAAASAIFGTTHKWYAWNDGTNAYFTNAASGGGFGLRTTAATVALTNAGNAVLSATVSALTVPVPLVTSDTVSMSAAMTISGAAESSHIKLSKTSATAQIWDVYNNGNFVVLDATGGSANMYLETSGNFTISGSTATKAIGTTWANPSDERLKTNIQNYGKGLAELMQMRFVTGEYNGLAGTPKGGKFISVIAQEAQQVLPDAVSVFEADGVNYLKYDASEQQVLVAVAVQQLAKQLATLQNEFAAYKAAHP